MSTNNNIEIVNNLPTNKEDIEMKNIVTSYINFILNNKNFLLSWDNVNSDIVEEFISSPNDTCGEIPNNVKTIFDDCDLYEEAFDNTVIYIGTLDDISSYDIFQIMKDIITHMPEEQIPSFLLSDDESDKQSAINNSHAMMLELSEYLEYTFIKELFRKSFLDGDPYICDYEHCISHRFIEDTKKNITPVRNSIFLNLSDGVVKFSIDRNKTDKHAWSLTKSENKIYCTHYIDASSNLILQHFSYSHISHKLESLGCVHSDDICADVIYAALINLLINNEEYGYEVTNYDDARILDLGIEDVVTEIYKECENTADMVRRQRHIYEQIHKCGCKSIKGDDNGENK